jgi:16S rRNA (guanine527-N7)-methyltransferase
MNYVPQIPKWGEEYTEKKLDELVSYHGWLASTAIKTGLISPKKEQAIWDEFIVHSLYFAKIIENLKERKEQILDLGTGAGIPGIPISIVMNEKVTLVDNKKTRIFELERLITTNSLKNVVAKQENAIKLMKSYENCLFTLRCYLSSSNLIKQLSKPRKTNIYLVSSSEKNSLKSNEMFHVKQEKFLINKTEYRFIDVITVR